MVLSKSRITLNYILTYLLICFSGISFFDDNRIARMGFLVLLGILFIYFRKKMGKELLVLIAISIYLVLFQTLYFGGATLFSTVTMISFLILMPYFAINLIGPRLLVYFRDIMIVIGIVSLVFWVLVNVSESLHNATQLWAVNLGAISNPAGGLGNDNFIIYTFEKQQVYGLYRNPGPFHEPGAFAVFLILGIISEIFTKGKISTRNNLIFFVNLITTFSTAGFLGLFVLVGFYVYTSKRMTFLTKVFVSISMLSIVVYLFLTLEFLGEKISSQMEEQTKAQLNTPTSGRFLGARKAFVVMYRYPLFGRGIIAGGKAEATSDEAAGYGWLQWVSQLGVFFGLMYMFILYKAFKNYSIINLNSKLFSLFAFGALLAVLSAQKFTGTLMFFSMFLLPLVFPIKKYANDYLIKIQKPIKEKKRSSLLSFSEQAKVAKRLKSRW